MLRQKRLNNRIPFSPKQVPGLLSWISAGEIKTTDTRNRIVEMKDLAGNNKTFSTATGNYEPVYCVPGYQQQLCADADNVAASSWIGTNCTSSASSELDPLGTSSAFVLTASAGSGRHYMNATSYTRGNFSGRVVSVSVKKVNKRYCWLGISSDSPWHGVCFDFDTGTVVGSIHLTNYSVLDQGSGWFRVTMYHEVTAVGVGTGISLGINNGTQSTSPESWTATGTEQMLVWRPHHYYADCTNTNWIGSDAAILPWKYGKPSVTFDGYDDGISGSNWGQPTVIFLVAQHEDTRISRYWIGGASTNKFYIGFSSTDSNHWSFGTSSAGMASGTIIPRQDGPDIVTAVFDGQNSVLRVNGIQGASLDTSTLAHSGLTIGNIAGYANAPVGTFHELLCYTRSLSQKEISKIEVYLMKKWGGTKKTFLPTDINNCTLWLDGSNISNNVENLLPYSEDFAAASWAAARCNVVTNAAANPRNGQLTADMYREDDSLNSHPLYTGTGISVIQNTRYCFSFNVKKINRHVSMRFETSVSGYAHFNLDTGSVYSVSGNVENAAITPLGNGWYNVYAECTASATGRAYLDIYAASIPGTNSYQGILNYEGFYLDAAVFRSIGSQNTYVPTTGAGVTLNTREDSYNRLSRWDDLSGNLKNVTQSTDANKPLLSRQDNKENLFRNSEDITKSTWRKVRLDVVDSVTVKAQNVTNFVYLDGNVSGYTPNIGTGQNVVLYGQFKSGTWNYIWFGDVAGSLYNGVGLDLNTGTITRTDNVVSSSIGSVDAEGYYPVTITINQTALTGPAGVGMYFSPSSGAAPGSSGTWAGTETVLTRKWQIRSESADASYLQTSDASQYRGINGLSAIVFDGTDDYFSGLALSNYYSATGKTVVAAVKTHTANVYQEIIDSASGNKFGMRVYSSGTKYNVYNSDGASNNQAEIAGLVPGTVQVVSAWHDGVKLGLALNGSFGDLVSNGSTDDLTQTLRIGSWGSGSAPWSGYLCELVVYNRALSFTERRKVEVYLKAKWGG